MKRSVVFLVMGAFLPLVAAIDAVKAPNTVTQIVNGQQTTTKITADSLYALASYAQMPAAQKKQFEDWLESDKAQAVIKGLLAFQPTAQMHAAVARGQMQQDKKLLQANDIENLSQWNYVFQVPGMTWYAKISGPANRYTSSTKALIAKGVKGTPIATYQTASRAANYLILKEFINKHNLNHLTAQETYLYPLVQQKGAPVSVADTNIVVLEQALPNGVQKLSEANAAQLSDAALRQLTQAIIGVGLWSINDNIFLKESDKGVHIVHLPDLEQPNISSPDDFFNRGKKGAHQYLVNIWDGIVGLAKLYQGHPEKLAVIKQVVDQSPVVQENFIKNHVYDNKSIYGLLKGAQAAPAAQEPSKTVGG